MIDQEFEMLYSDEIFCIVEYQNEGSSKTILRQYKQSPQGFAYARKLKLEYSSSLLEIFKNTIHLTSCGIFARDTSITFKDNKYKLLTICLFPLGFLFNKYINWQIKKELR
jgi:hypothetical protein